MEKECFFLQLLKQVAACIREKCLWALIFYWILIQTSVIKSWHTFPCLSAVTASTATGSALALQAESRKAQSDAGMLCWGCLLWHMTGEGFPSHAVRCCAALAPCSSCAAPGIWGSALLRQHLLGGKEGVVRGFLQSKHNMKGVGRLLPTLSSQSQGPGCNYPSPRVTVDFSHRITEC